jgi:nitroimidazol reductase NimA-like FMN-containing flavoprotein (pyridoxamine 5'-phosphate oxidase superfamily)
MAETETAQVEIIPDWECLRLLQSKHAGRLGFVAGDQPLILPVTYAVEDGTIVLRTGPGTKMANAPLTRVAFEVDHIDEASESGWSVLIQGVAQDITTGIDASSERLRGLAPQPWAGGDRDHYIRIVPRQITGRRVHPPEVDG